MKRTSARDDRREAASRLFEAAQSVAAKADDRAGWSPDELAKRLLRYVGTAAKGFAVKPWKDAAKDFIEKFMNSYAGACMERDFFMKLDVLPVITCAARGLLPPEVGWRELEDLVAEEQAQMMDRILLRISLWELSQRYFEAPYAARFYQAITRAHALANAKASKPRGSRDKLEDFMQRWIYGTLQRAWTAVEKPEELLSCDRVSRLFKASQAPLGERRPSFSCVPHSSRRGSCDIQKVVKGVLDCWRTAASRGGAKRSDPTGDGQEQLAAEIMKAVNAMNEQRQEEPAEPAEPSPPAAGPPAPRKRRRAATTTSRRRMPMQTSRMVRFHVEAAMFHNLNQERERLSQIYVDPDQDVQASPPATRKRHRLEAPHAATPSTLEAEAQSSSAPAAASCSSAGRRLAREEGAASVVPASSAQSSSAPAAASCSSASQRLAREEGAASAVRASSPQSSLTPASASREPQGQKVEVRASSPQSSLTPASASRGPQGQKVEVHAVSQGSSTPAGTSWRHQRQRAAREELGCPESSSTPAAASWRHGRQRLVRSPQEGGPLAGLLALMTSGDASAFPRFARELEERRRLLGRLRAEETPEQQKARLARWERIQTWRIRQQRPEASGGAGSGRWPRRDRRRASLRKVEEEE